jgi:hypothetical protein
VSTSRCSLFLSSGNTATRSLFESPALASYKPSVFDASGLRPGPSDDKVMDLVDRSDVVLAVFTRRHREHSGVWVHFNAAPFRLAKHLEPANHPGLPTL